MNYFLNQIVRGLSVFLRTFRAFFSRKLMGVGSRLRRMLNFSRNATKVATSSLQGVMSAAQKPTSRSDYVETGRLFISKALIIRVLLILVALGLIVYFLAWPFILSRFLTARFYREDKRVKDWSGRVVVYSDKKKTLPLYAGRLEDGVLQGECRQYASAGVLLYEGMLKDGQRSGNGREYEDGVLIYEGSFAEGIYSGRGKLYEEGQPVYEGQFDGGRRSGSGTAYRNGQLLYVGQYLEDQYEGRGKLYENGSLVYDGGFAAGIPEGSGTAYQDGQVLYEGQFAGGLFEGEGKLYSTEDGGHFLCYDGDFRGGVPEGTGTYYFENGNPSYKGDVQDGAPNGNGTFYAEQDRRTVYEGGVKDGLYDGQGTWFLPDGQISGSFRQGGPMGSVEYRKNGLLYYQGEWGASVLDGEPFDGFPSGFGTLYNKAGKVIYSGPFREGTVDGSGLLGYTTEKLREALGEGTVRIEREEEGYRIIAEELGLTALCTFQTEEEPSAVYRLYLYQPQEGDWVALLPGQRFTGGVSLPEGATPTRASMSYQRQTGVNLDSGTYTAVSGEAYPWRVTAYFPREGGQRALLLTWARQDVVPKAAPEAAPEEAEVDSVAAFLAALDEMDAAAGSQMSQGAVFGDSDPGEAFSRLEDAGQAASLADAMLSYWEQTERINALQEAADRVTLLLEKEKEDLAKGVGSQAAADALEQQLASLTGETEACLTAIKRAELQAGDTGSGNLADYALGDMVLDFDPSAQEVGELTLVAVAYAQATGSDLSPEAVGTQVKLGLLDLTDAYGAVKKAMTRYQTASADTKASAGDYSMGLGSKEAWYAAMNEETLARADLCSALSEFSRQANQFNLLTGGWVSRSFDWQKEAFEPLFRAAILPEPEQASEEALPDSP